MSPSIWQLLIVLAIVLVLFGAKRLRNIGTDLGGAVKGFKSAMHDGDESERRDNEEQEADRLNSQEDDTSGDHTFDQQREDSDSRR